MSDKKHSSTRHSDNKKHKSANKPINKQHNSQQPSKQAANIKNNQLKKVIKNKAGQQSKQKSGMHPRNAHTGRYNLAELSKSLPELTQFIILNPSNEPTIDFSNPEAVKTLNKALLVHFYGIDYWAIPEGFLCPPIPSRADYIHHLADLLDVSTKDGKKHDSKKQPKTVHALDIGTGANLIYPIIGSQCYDWQFTATDIDALAIANAHKICANNPRLQNKISLKQQQNPAHIFKGIIGKDDKFTITLCNPPFHASLAEAIASNTRKRSNLAHNKKKRSTHNKTGKAIAQNGVKAVIGSTDLNFGGQKAELWFAGGEISFLQRMAKESLEFKEQVQWFTTLVSKAENVYPLTKLLKKLQVTQIKEIKMTHGQKTTRVIAWQWV